ncbi:MAG: RHS repeat-associated core domain-containing protein [Acetatifactor sp.]
MRFELLENGRCTSFVYHESELLHEEGREENQTSYHLGLGIDAFQRGQELSYYHRNEQLSTAFITGGHGEVYNSYQYDAFGAGIEATEQLSNRIRYTGQQYDDLTGQYYLRARYYNPILGRFMQEDTYWGDGLNLYAYCGNNPVMYFDPSGYTNHATGSGCPPKGKIDEGKGLDDDAAVVRGGTCRAEQFTNGSGVTTGSDGKLNGVSVSSGNGLTIEELSAGDPHGKVGVTTVGAIRDIGGDVVPSPSSNNPYHCTLSGITAEQAESLFTPVIQNPSKK